MLIDEAKSVERQLEESIRIIDLLFIRALMKAFETSSIKINLKHKRLISERKCRFLGNYRKGEKNTYNVTNR